MRRIALLTVFLFMSSGAAESRGFGGNEDIEREFRFRKNVDIEGIQLSYNRVEGLFAGWGFPKRYDSWSGGSKVTFYGLLGYGTAMKDWRYRVGLSRSFLAGGSLEAGGEYYDLTETEDLWVIGTMENTLATLLLHNDFQDFYEIEGYKLYVRQEIGKLIALEAGFREDDNTWMDAKTDWSLFYRDRTYRDNPWIEEGKMKTTYLKLSSLRSYRMENWNLYALAEFNTDRLTDSYDSFSRFIVDVQRYQEMGRSDNLNVRLRWGSSTGRLPIQKKFDLGGISTLRGYSYKEFADGDKMLLLNVEYVMDPETVGGISDLPVFGEMMLILFLDAGSVWVGSRALPEFEDVKRNIGVGIANKGGDYRVNFAKPLDAEEGADDVIITFRLRAAF